MRVHILMALAALGAAANAQQIKRLGAPEAPIAASTEVPAGARIVYLSGAIADPVKPAADGAPADYGDTTTQARSIFAKLAKQLAQHGMTMGDVAMMRVFLVAPPGQPRMDFQAMMTAYKEYFGTPAQPNKPARTTVQVVALAAPGALVEIEATAAKLGQ